MLSRIARLRGVAVRTHVNPHGGLKRPRGRQRSQLPAVFGPTLILTED